MVFTIIMSISRSIVSMGTQNLWYFREQLFRIIEESLEVSLAICNAELSEFTVAKIFDIFNQILPTGFVLSTGYWPFFNTSTRQSICICGRYGLECRHFRHDYHWISLDNIPNDQTMTFSARHGHLTLVHSEIDLTPITGGIAGYTLNTKLAFQYKKAERGRPRRKRDDTSCVNPDQLFQVLICSRYILQREYYPALQGFIFQPCPFFCESYGTCFPKLLQARESFRKAQQINQQCYNVLMENMPHFTLVLQHVNMPVHLFSKSLIQVNMTHLDSVRHKKTVFNKSIQTEHSEAAEIWRYKEMIGNLKTLWTDSRSSSCESVYVNSNIEMSYGAATSGNAITDSIRHSAVNSEFLDNIKKEVKEEEDLNRTQDAEYDTQWPQWGYQKTISNKRGRRRLAPMTPEKSKHKKLTSAPSYASILKSCKPAESKGYKEDPDFKWFDSQFPDLIGKGTKKRENVEEDFDIAEEFIKQEKEDEDMQTGIRQPC